MDFWYSYAGYMFDRGLAQKKYDTIFQIGPATIKYTAEEKGRLFKGESVVFDDLLVELIQHVDDGSLGWFYHCKADYLLYLIMVGDSPAVSIPVKLHVIKYPEFYEWFSSIYVFEHVLSGSKIISSSKSRKGGLSINIPVPIQRMMGEPFFLRTVHMGDVLPFEVSDA